MRIYKVLLTMMLGVSMVFTSCAQVTTKPFYKDIQEFKRQDRENPPPKNPIVFVGSSSFTMWKDVQTYFPGYPIVNRGFGGSTLAQAIDYADDIITVYQPRQVVIYSGENDLANSGKVTADDVVHRFITLFKKIRAKAPEANIVFVSMKPSPSRKHLMPIMANANEKIKDYLSKDKNAGYVDVYSLMLDSSGNPRVELFKEDMLHMKKAGYRIWKDALDPVLMK